MIRRIFGKVIFGLSSSTVTYSYSQADDEQSQLGDKNPVDFSKGRLTRSELISASCAQTIEQASAFQTNVVMAAETRFKDYFDVMSEMANLYEESYAILTPEGERRIQELKVKYSEMKKSANEMEMLSQFVKKLMESGAEVCYLAGAEFASIQATERSISAQKSLSGLFTKAKLMDLDLIRAQESHILKVGKLMESIEKDKEEQ